MKELSRANVLAIDGGGIRGIIPALLLAEIEKRTGKAIARLFDLIAGTSTGGLLALGLSVPGRNGHPRYRAAELVDLYEKEGKRIFSRSVWHRIHAAGSMLEEKYPAAGIDAVLNEYLGESRLKDALTDVLITAYEIERRMPFFFKSRKARERDDYDFPMKWVARATSAAPTYFEPVKIEAQGGSEYFALIDGGVFASNPAMCAYAEIKSTNPEIEDVLMLSLGTGELTRRIPYDEARGWGLLNWAQPILSVVFDGVSDTVDYQLRQLLPPARDGSRRYYRLQTTLYQGNDDMDDASRTNLTVLRLLAEEIIYKNSDLLDKLCRQLV